MTAQSAPMSQKGTSTWTGGNFPYRPLVIVPTYNERDNIETIVDRLFVAVPSAHLLIVDDGSPDGTGDLADKLAEKDSRVDVMHRCRKSGLGAAYLAGFDWALARDYDAVVEMDADGSHAPEELSLLLTALSQCDLVLGSRWVPGGVVQNWPTSRKVLSLGGNTYTRLALGLGLKDATGGFRVFRADVLRQIDPNEVSSQGYCFQVEMVWRVAQAGFSITECPITFHERQRGTSKMDSRVVSEALIQVTRWGARHRAHQLRNFWARVSPNTRDQGVEQVAEHARLPECSDA